jgi:hypothetical protein
MAEFLPRTVLDKVRRLAMLPVEVRQSRWAVPVTRLTILKTLCRDPQDAYPFVVHLAHKTLARLQRKQARPTGGKTAKRSAHRQMMADALAAMEDWIATPTDAGRADLRRLLNQLQDEQNEHRRIKFGTVRIINDSALLVVEYALQCLVNPESKVGHWAYQTARHYTERYDSPVGTGLIKSSARLLQDIADFWLAKFGLNPEALAVLSNKPRKATGPKGNRYR